MKTYFYNPTDNYGQHTGETKTIELSENQIEYDFPIKERANKYYKGKFLFECKYEAIRSALQ